MSRYDVRYNVKEIRDLSYYVRKQKNKLHDMSAAKQYVGQAHESWTGEASDAFFVKANKSIEDIRKSLNVFDSLSRILNNAADEILEQERRITSGLRGLQ